MAKKVTTLYIGDTEVTLLVMKGMQVQKWAALPLEPGLVSQGLITDEARVAELVKELFAREKANTRKVIVAVSGHETLYRMLTLPDVPEAVLPEAVKREAKRTIPTPLDQVYYSYQNIPAMKGERKIFLATFPRAPVDALVRTLHQAGVRPCVMDLAPLAITRLPDVPRAIIVNSRLDHLEIVVVADRLPLVIRTLSLPGESDSMDDKLPLVAEELNRTILFYNSSHMEHPLDPGVPVFVSGDLAGVPETWEVLVGNSGYSISPLPSPVEAPEGFTTNQFSVNIGLALKDVLPAKADAHFSLVNFNALPEAYVPPRFSIIRVLIPVGLVIGIGLVVFVMLFSSQVRARIQELQPQVAAREATVRQLNTDIASLRSGINSDKSRTNILNNRISGLQLARAEMHEDLRAIDALARAMDDVTVHSISHGGGSITLSGRADDEDAAYAYARQLREMGRFSDVWMPSISGSPGAFSFRIDLGK